MAQALSAIISQLDQAYNPQRAVYQSQIDAIPAQQQAQQAGLDQAKTNAFSDINTNANAKGMFYSGMPITEQAKYVGSTYLPAVAGLKQNSQDNQFKLQSAIAGLTGDEYKTALATRNDQLAAEQQAAAKLATARSSRSSRGSGGGGSSSSSGNVDYNARGVKDWISYIQKNYSGKSWGAVAKAIEAEGGKIGTGTNLDQALHFVYTGAY